MSAYCGFQMLAKQLFQVLAELEQQGWLMLKQLLNRARRALRIN